MILFATVAIICVLLVFFVTITNIYLFERKRKRTRLLGCGGSKHPLTATEIRAIEERVANRPKDQ